MYFIDIKNISFITQTGYVIEPGSGRNIYTNRWKHTFSFFIIVILLCYCKSFFSIFFFFTLSFVCSGKDC